VLRQIAISKTEPGDENNQDISTLVGKVDIRMLDRYSQNDPDAYSYSGGLCLANQGLLEFVEMFKAPIKVLHPLLTATQESNFKGTEGFGAIPTGGPPPAPITTTGPAPGCQSGCVARRLRMKPKESLLLPARRPSGKTVTQLMAPITRAASLTSSTACIAVCLWGIVMLAPAKPKAGSARSAATIPSGGIAKGT
jgi:hypothetical protein